MLSNNVVHLSSHALHDLVAALGDIADLADGGEDKPSHWAVGLTAFDNNTLIGFESIISRSTAAVLFSALYGVCPDSALCKLAIVSHVYGLTPSIAPKDVSGQTESTIGAVRFDSATQDLVCEVKVKNVSGRTLSGPITVVFNVPGDVKLLNAGGKTCVLSPYWMDYKIISKSGLSNGTTARAQLRLHCDDGVEIPIEVHRVVAGKGKL
jgi:hypothetical protein